MENYKLMLGFSICLAVDCQGRSSCLALLWITEVQVLIRNYSTNHIHATIVDNTTSQTSWDFTGTYGFLEARNMHKTWNRIHMLHQQSQDKWFVCGDFNEVMSQHEKCGGKQKADGLLLDFCSMAVDCELADLGYVGLNFTWCNNREGVTRISE